MSGPIVGVYAFGLSSGRMIVNGAESGTHPMTEAVTLPWLLDVASEVFTAAREGVIVIGADVADRLGFPAKAPSEGRRGALGVELLTDAKTQGWRITGVAPWMTFWGSRRPTVHVAVWPWLDLGDGAELAGYVGRLAQYHVMTGGSYHTTPGVAGIGLLRDHYAPGLEPFWRPPFDGCSALSAVTDDASAFRMINPLHAPGGDRPHEHCYDVNRQYLTAAGVAELAPGPLHHEGPRVFDPNRPGYWLISPLAWNFRHMPHPAGTATAGTASRWVTTPTMRLIRDIADQGFISEPDVIDSWLGERRTRVLRSWSEALRDAVRLAIRNVETADPGSASDAGAVLDLIKQTYREGIAMLGRPGGRVYRPDWRHTIVATARANLYRKLWRIGHQTGAWPGRIMVDAVHYASSTRDPLAFAEAIGIPVGTGPGEFKVITDAAPAVPAMAREVAR